MISWYPVMLVLKHSSPPVSPRWPSATPRATVPSDRTSLAGSRVGEEDAWVMGQEESQWQTAAPGAIKKPPQMGRAEELIQRGRCQWAGPGFGGNVGRHGAWDWWRWQNLPIKVQAGRKVSQPDFWIEASFRWFSNAPSRLHHKPGPPPAQKQMLGPVLKDTMLSPTARPFDAPSCCLQVRPRVPTPPSRGAGRRAGARRCPRALVAGTVPTGPGRSVRRAECGPHPN